MCVHININITSISCSINVFFQFVSLSRLIPVFVLPGVAPLFMSRSLPSLPLPFPCPLALFFAGALIVSFVFIDMLASLVSLL